MIESDKRAFQSPWKCSYVTFRGHFSIAGKAWQINYFHYFFIKGKESLLWM